MAEGEDEESWDTRKKMGSAKGDDETTDTSRDEPQHRLEW